MTHTPGPWTIVDDYGRFEDGRMLEWTKTVIAKAEGK